MTEEELQREREEAERLRNQISSLRSQISEEIRKQRELERELICITNEVYQLIGRAKNMDVAVNKELDILLNKTKKAELETTEVFEALKSLCTSYFLFKNISTASKNISQYTDEYYTKFANYNELRRITLGYVVGIDAHICSSESMRKKVEKAYLQNTEYWLAYCIAATMLWASNEREGAERAIGKSLSVNYYNSCLYYLLINLRFRRLEAAKKWFMNYLDKVNMNELGDEWQYLLQAYLTGALGDDENFQEQVGKCFEDMIAKIEVANVDYGKKVVQKAQIFSETYLHKTEHEYLTLRKTCAEYEDLKSLLSDAEKNRIIAKYYNQIAEQKSEDYDTLGQRIENVLYSLINNYDADELIVIKKLKYNEAIVAAKGDITSAKANFDAMFEESNAKKSLDDLLIKWAFETEASQADIAVKQFSISYLKEWIIAGFDQFVQQYRGREKDKYTITIDKCELSCGENDFEEAKKGLEAFYNKNKLRYAIKDKFILIYSACCFTSLFILVIMMFVFSKVALVFSILLGLVGSFLLWRRIVDMKKIIDEKKCHSVNKLKQALNELKQWRISYKEEDMRSMDLKSAFEKF